jgi:hypothetical protein
MGDARRLSLRVRGGAKQDASEIRPDVEVQSRAVVQGGLYRQRGGSRRRGRRNFGEVMRSSA